jgi:hypothetical protein
MYIAASFTGDLIAISRKDRLQIFDFNDNREITGLI